jgi:hypothetical protein
MDPFRRVDRSAYPAGADMPEFPDWDLGVHILFKGLQVREEAVVSQFVPTFVIDS